MNIVRTALAALGLCLIGVGLWSYFTGSDLMGLAPMRASVVVGGLGTLLAAAAVFLFEWEKRRATR